MHCADIEPELQAAVDNELSPDCHAAVTDHCRECEACAARLHTLRQAANVMRMSRPARGSAFVPPAVLVALAESGGPRRTETGILPWLFLAAAAACALVLIGIYSPKRATRSPASTPAKHAVADEGADTSPWSLSPTGARMRFEMPPIMDFLAMTRGTAWLDTAGRRTRRIVPEEDLGDAGYLAALPENFEGDCLAIRARIRLPSGETIAAVLPGNADEVWAGSAGVVSRESDLHVIHFRLTDFFVFSNAPLSYVAVAPADKVEDGFGVREWVEDAEQAYRGWMTGYDYAHATGDLDPYELQYQPIWQRFFPHEPGTYGIALDVIALTRTADTLVKTPWIAMPEQTVTIRAVTGEWSEPVDGLQARLVLPEQQGPGAAIRLAMQLRNSGTDTLHYNFCGNTAAEVPQPYHFRLWWEDQELLQDAADMFIGPGSTFTPHVPGTIRTVAVPGSWFTLDGKPWPETIVTGIHSLHGIFEFDVRLAADNDPRWIWSGKLEIPPVACEFRLPR